MQHHFEVNRMSEPFEVEIKIPVEDLVSIEKKIESLGATRLNQEIQLDEYFAHPCRSFSDTDEALRLRARKSLTGEEISAEMTYKGPKIDPLTKTRVEISIIIPDYEMQSAMLRHLGFISVATVTKQRTFYSFEGTTISLDDVENVGTFIELERVVDSPSEIGPSREVIFDIVRRLDLRPEKSIRKSYLELYLERSY